jgi:hypothetical protein
VLQFQETLPSSGHAICSITSTRQPVHIRRPQQCKRSAPARQSRDTALRSAARPSRWPAEDGSRKESQCGGGKPDHMGTCKPAGGIRAGTATNTPLYKRCPLPAGCLMRASHEARLARRAADCADARAEGRKGPKYRQQLLVVHVVRNRVCAVDHLYGNTNRNLGLEGYHKGPEHRQQLLVVHVVRDRVCAVDHLWRNAKC